MAKTQTKIKLSAKIGRFALMTAFKIGSILGSHKAKKQLQQRNKK